jgi:hypothetical protein
LVTRAATIADMKQPPKGKRGHKERRIANQMCPGRTEECRQGKQTKRYLSRQKKLTEEADGEV